jgi:hypothetical protein
MAVYVDGLTGCLATGDWHYTRSCHLVADTEEELREFAIKIGCKPQWIQISLSCLIHFDLTARMREKAVEHGAKEITRLELVDLIVKNRAKQGNCP